MHHLMPFIPLVTLPYIFLARKNLEDLIAIKWVLIFYCFALGWNCFCSPIGMIFECDKTTKRCEHRELTKFNSTLHTIQSVDLKGRPHIELQEKRTWEITEKRRIGIKRKIYYKVILYSGSDEISFPTDFTNQEEAEHIAYQLNDFLNTNKQEYIYQEGHFELNKTDEIYKISFFAALLYLVIFHKFIKYLKRKTPPDTNTKNDYKGDETDESAIR